MDCKVEGDLLLEKSTTLIFKQFFAHIEDLVQNQIDDVNELWPEILDTKMPKNSFSKSKLDKNEICAVVSVT